jgi:hypothetical protein
VPDPLGPGLDFALSSLSIWRTLSFWTLSPARRDSASISSDRSDSVSVPPDDWCAVVGRFDGPASRTEPSFVTLLPASNDFFFFVDSSCVAPLFGQLWLSVAGTID